MAFLEGVLPQTFCISSLWKAESKQHQSWWVILKYKFNIATIAFIKSKFIKGQLILIYSSSAKLIGLPESCSDINSIVNSLTKQRLFTNSSSSCPIAQNAFNPFISAGIKTEIPDPDFMDWFWNLSLSFSKWNNLWFHLQYIHLLELKSYSFLTVQYELKLIKQLFDEFVFVSFILKWIKSWFQI